MTDTKRTPGPTPWTVQSGISDPEMYSVRCKYVVADRLPIEDARLISAAPDMMEALEQLLFVHVNHLQGVFRREDLPLSDIDEYPVIKAARAALAKAKGE